MQVAKIAELCHEVNTALCRLHGEYLHPSWGNAPDDQKESITRGVQAILDDPGLTPPELHQHWLEHKLAQGWVHGPYKDHANKMHPNLLPFEELPREQQLKDALFMSVVHACMYAYRDTNKQPAPDQDVAGGQVGEPSDAVGKSDPTAPTRGSKRK